MFRASVNGTLKRKYERKRQEIYDWWRLAGHSGLRDGPKPEIRGRERVMPGQSNVSQDSDALHRPADTDRRKSKVNLNGIQPHKHSPETKWKN